jgi:KDO2-lipid IV(A) lauroyltransferase
MKSALVVWTFDLIARLPLSMLHRMGAVLGWMTYLLSKKYSTHLRENLRYACKDKPEAEYRRILHANIGEIGKSFLELSWVWRRPLGKVLQSVRSVRGIEHIEAARQRGKGIIFLTPHLGCFEIIGLYLAAQMPMTCMYRVPKMPWLDPVIRGGRERAQMHLARADLGGVRVLLKALKRGEAIGVLPDQVPGNGEGEWASFFGRQAYTMTLAGRLIESSGASVLLSYCERLPRGGGYVLHFIPLELVPEKSIAQQINEAQEKIILACPEQYLWSYNRYKVPAGVLPPDMAGAH